MFYDVRGVDFLDTGARSVWATARPLRTGVTSGPEPGHHMQRPRSLGLMGWNEAAQIYGPLHS